MKGRAQGSLKYTNASPTTALEVLTKYHQEFKAAENDQFKRRLAAFFDPTDVSSNGVTMPNAPPASVVTTATGSATVTVTGSTTKNLVVAYSPYNGMRNRQHFMVIPTDGAGTATGAAQTFYFGLSFNDSTTASAPISAMITMSNTTNELNRSGTMSAAMYPFPINAVDLTVGKMSDYRAILEDAIIQAPNTWELCGIWRSMAGGSDLRENDYLKTVTAIEDTSDSGTGLQVKSRQIKADAYNISGLSTVAGSALQGTVELKSLVDLRAQTGFCFNIPEFNTAGNNSTASMYSAAFLVHGQGNIGGSYNLTNVTVTAVPVINNAVDLANIGYGIIVPYGQRSGVTTTGSSYATTSLLFDTNRMTNNPIPDGINTFEIDMFIPSAGVARQMTDPSIAIDGVGGDIIAYWTVTGYAEDGVTTVVETQVDNLLWNHGARPLTTGMTSYGVLRGWCDDLTLRRTLTLNGTLSVVRITVALELRMGLKTRIPDTVNDADPEQNPSGGRPNHESTAARWDPVGATVDFTFFTHKPPNDIRVLYMIAEVKEGHSIKIEAASACSILPLASLSALTRHEKLPIISDPAIEGALKTLAGTLPCIMPKTEYEAQSDILTSDLAADAVRDFAGNVDNVTVGEAFSLKPMVHMLASSAKYARTAADVGAAMGAPAPAVLALRGVATAGRMARRYERKR